MQRIWPLIAFLTVAVSCKTPAPQAFTIPVFEPGKQAKNIILLIGDGMGLGQVSAAMYTNNNRLAMAEFPVVGFHKTYSADQLITDSAAGATAFACGQKTYNGAIGVTNDTLPCFTIMEEARQNGLATGLIATAAIVHATPAAFLSHVDNRISYEDIALDFVNHPADLLIGGGSQYFKSRETDQRDLYTELRKKKYYVSDHSMEDLLRAPFRADQGFAYFTAEGHPGTYAQNRTYLPFATRYGLKYLSQRSAKGFFVMIEGSQIDWKCHSGEGKEAILETLDFDSAVREALEFAKDRDDTLVIVTADHETGGMSIVQGSTMDSLDMKFTTKGHTASMIPVFAYGPGSEMFGGLYENTDIFFRIKKAMGWERE